MKTSVVALHCWGARAGYSSFWVVKGELPEGLSLTVSSYF